MSFFDANVEIGGVIDAFRRVERLPIAKVFRTARPDLRKELRSHGQASEGPGGKWEGLSSTTIARRARARRKRRGKLLGRLTSAFRIEANGKMLRATSLAKWSRVHNEGGRGGKGSRIPERRFMWVSNRFSLTLRNHFRAELWRAWTGR